MLLGCPLLSGAERSSPKPDAFRFSFFRDNGQDGLFLAWSRDGLRWSELQPPGKSFLAPTLGGKLMRDPCLRQGPDGTFHLVWTTGSGDLSFPAGARHGTVLRVSEEVLRLLR